MIRTEVQTAGNRTCHCNLNIVNLLKVESKHRNIFLNIISIVIVVCCYVTLYRNAATSLADCSLGMQATAMKII